jgi:hypothetical protein
MDAAQLNGPMAQSTTESGRSMPHVGKELSLIRMEISILDNGAIVRRTVRACIRTQRAPAM